ncbi:MAG: DUF494 family protein [Ignavibacteria bacterium]
MTAKIVEVLAKILEALGNNYSLEEVNKKLSKDKRFDMQTLSVAFSWLYDKKLANGSHNIFNKDQKLSSFRFLTEEEKEVIGIENYNYIIHLINVGLLKMPDIDAILAQIAFYPGNKISKEEINWLILFSLVDFGETVLPGSRFLLYSSDTIN